MTLLPLGVVDFARLRQRGCLYADKTRIFYDLVTQHTPFFLSRPRGFGKSLLLSALEAILRGRRELFEGLWIDGSDYDWAQYPVIRLSLAGLATDSVDALERGMSLALGAIAEREGLTLQDSHPLNAFVGLIDDLHYKYHQKVAILIDDYDAPVLENLANSKLADEIRRSLTSFYGIIKGVEAERGFILFTGVGQFAMGFLAPNNLYDLTLDDEYAAICGFTIEEFDSLFRVVLEDRLEDFKSRSNLPLDATVADLRGRILEMYGGYSWDGETRVLNPWSTLKCLDRGKLSNYWFQSDSSTFLDDLIKRKTPDYDYLSKDYTFIDGYNAMEVDELEPADLMFHSGCLTVKSFSGADFFNLNFPNLEVRASLLPWLMSIDRRLLAEPLEQAASAKAMLAASLARDAEGLAAAFGSFLAIIPSKLHRPEPSFYRTAFFMAMALAGQPVAMGKAASEERSGVVVFLEESKGILVMELEYRETEGALEVAVTMALVERTGYDIDYEAEYETIHKATLVVTGRADESVAIEIASGWRLAKAGKGSVVERTEPDRGSRARPPRPPKAPGSPNVPKKPKS
jgi:hypothetical protein